MPCGCFRACGCNSCSYASQTCRSALYAFNRSWISPTPSGAETTSQTNSICSTMPSWQIDRLPAATASRSQLSPPKSVSRPLGVGLLGNMAMATRPPFDPQWGKRRTINGRTETYFIPTHHAPDVSLKGTNKPRQINSPIDGLGRLAKHQRVIEISVDRAIWSSRHCLPEAQ
jgi:hypothetical protein